MGFLIGRGSKGRETYPSAARAGGGTGTTPHIVPFDAPGTFTPPPGVTSVLVQGFGGGAGGGGGSQGNVAAGVGGGGGGGAVWGSAFVPITPGVGVAVGIGAGGAGGAADTGAGSTQGSPGGDTTFGSLLAFTGAGGGAAGNNQGPVSANLNGAAGTPVRNLNTNPFGVQTYTSNFNTESASVGAGVPGSGGSSINAGFACAGLGQAIGLAGAPFAGGVGGSIGMPSTHPGGLGGGGGGGGPDGAGGVGATGGTGATGAGAGSVGGTGASAAANSGAGGGGGGQGGNAATTPGNGGPGGAGGSGFLQVIYWA